MKTSHAVLSVCVAALIQCRGNPQTTMTEESQIFPTLDEAVARAKGDLLQVVSEQQELRLGVDSATLQQSQSGAPIRRIEVDFQKLLSADSTTPLASLARADVSTIVPLLHGDTVVTIVELSKEQPGWRVIGLAGVGIASDLSRVRRSQQGSAPESLTLYEVPNIEAHIYAVMKGGRELLFTSYRGRFTLETGLRAAVLIPVLKEDAVAFEREYGETLKQRRLAR